MTNLERSYDYIEKSYAVPYGDGYVYQIKDVEAVRQAFFDGLEEGQTKWHSLRKDDTDYPSDNDNGKEFYCKMEDVFGAEVYETLIWYVEYQDEGEYRIPVDSKFITKSGIDMSDKVIAWCIPPRFEE